MKMKKILVVLVLFAGIPAMGFPGEADSKALYTAVEYSFSEFFPINLGMKIGCEKIYGHFGVAFDPFEEGSLGRNAAFVLGLGAILSITDAFFFNPEFFGMGNLKEFQAYLGMVPYFGVNILKRLSLAVGPSVIWSRVTAKYALREPSFAFFEDEYLSNDATGRNSIVVGARAALRLKL